MHESLIQYRLFQKMDTREDMEHGGDEGLPSEEKMRRTAARVGLVIPQDGLKVSPKKTKAP